MEGWQIESTQAELIASEHAPKSRFPGGHPLRAENNYSRDN